MNTDDEVTCHAPEVWSTDYVRKIWASLEGRCAQSFFQSFVWTDAWLTIGIKYVKPLIFKSGSDVVGICLVGKGHSRDLKIIPYNTVFLSQAGRSNVDIVTSEYNDILVLPEYAASARQAFVRYFAREKKFFGNERIILERIPESSLTDFTHPDYETEIYKREEAVIIHFKEHSEETLFSKSFLSKIKRSVRFYHEKYGEPKFERAANVTQAQNWFAELGKLNQIRYRNKGTLSAWDYPELVRMHRALLDRYFKDGVAELIRVKAGEKPVGYLYNFLYRGRVYFYMSGFELEADNKAKPGLLTHYFCILDHFRSGAETYDFLAGHYRYKYEMGVPGDKMVSVCMTKPSLKYHIAHMLYQVKRKCREIFSSKE